MGAAAPGVTLVKESQYVDQYLDGAAYTVDTFLAYSLRGKASLWRSCYRRALMTALERRVKAGTVAAARSLHGGVAYRRVAP